MKKLLLPLIACLSSVFVQAQTADSLTIVRLTPVQIKIVEPKQATLIESIEKDLDYIRKYVSKGAAVPQWPAKVASNIGVLQRTGYDVKAYINEYKYYQKKVEQINN